MKNHEVKLHKLRPTQMTVGLIEVHDKKARLEKLSHHEQQDFLKEHPIPAVWGPEEKLYITDHHHLGRAVHDAGIDTAFFLIEEDFSNHSVEKFWDKMKDACWAHPVDENGHHHSCDQIPNHLEKLRDDIYRSFAAYVRNAGGFEKTPTAFAEFQWADFFRKRLEVNASNFHTLVVKGVDLAHTSTASHLPGFIVDPKK
jgi:hypothetical protein